MESMDTANLFTAALRLDAPWRINSVEFREAEKGKMELHLTIGFAKVARFKCP